MTNWTSHSVTTPASRGVTVQKPIKIGPTVSLEARPIVIPILSAMFGFPVLALALICCLRYRARRARLRSHLKRARKSAIVRGGHHHHKHHHNKHDYKSGHLHVLRDPATFTELSVIGSHAQSSNSDDEVRAPYVVDDDDDDGRQSSSRSPTPTPSPSPSPKQMSNGNLRMAFQTTPLEILTGTSGLEFTYTVVEQC